MRYEIRQIDSMCDPESGWNDSIKIGNFDTNSKDHKRAFLNALHKLGIVCSRGRIEVTSDGGIYKVQDRYTKELLFIAIPLETQGGKIVVFHDKEHNNTALIEEVNILPYCGAAKREKGYRVTCMANYDGNFIYHVSVFETLEDAKADIITLCFEI